MLQILNRDGTFYESITKYSFDTWVFEDINEIKIEWNPHGYMGKIAYLYDNDLLVGSGIIENSGYNKNSNEGKLVVYPLVYDLSQDLIADNTGNIVYFNDDLANVVESIIAKYRNTVQNPILYMKSKAMTGITVKYAFAYKTWLEWINLLKSDFLKGGNFITVDPDGGVNVKNTVTTHIMNYGSDILNMKYDELGDEILNFVYFDNSIPGDGHIVKTYQDSASIATFGKRVAYIKDSRFKYVESADAYIANFFEKHAKPKIVVESIKTEDLSVQLYDKITINNWEKSFDDELSVVGLTYIKDGILEIKVGTDIRRSEYVPPVSGDILNEANSYTDDKVANIPVYTPPAYIQETYIDSVEMRSPIIKGNQGYIYDKLLIGPNGIIIDGTNELIRSSNFVSGSSGWRFDDNGNLEANNATLRGNLLAGSININNNFTVDNSGNVRGNDFINKTILFEKLGSTPSWQDGKMWCEDNLPNQKVLWGYFGGDSVKQQVSTSRMQTAGSFDKSGNDSISVTTWFQPRLLMFNGFFENIGQEIFGTTNGQAGSVSSQQGFCNGMKLDFQTDSVMQSFSSTFRNYTEYPATYYSQALHAYTYYSVGIWHPTSIKAIQHVSAFAADDTSPNVSAYVSQWRDNGITIQIIVSPGWRLSWNFTILW